MFLITILLEAATNSFGIFDIMVGTIGTGIVGYLISKIAKLEKAVEEARNNHIKDLNRIITDKDNDNEQLLTFAKNLYDLMDKAKSKDS